MIDQIGTYAWIAIFVVILSVFFLLGIWICCKTYIERPLKDIHIELESLTRVLIKESNETDYHPISTGELEETQDGNVQEGIIYYCQDNKEEEAFEKFCKRFLQKIPVERIDKDMIQKRGVRRICIVLNVLQRNRSNPDEQISEVLSELHDYLGNTEAMLVLISFCGNGSHTKFEFGDEDYQSIKSHGFEECIVSYTNIVFEGYFDFQEHWINSDATSKIEMFFKE